MRSRNAFSKSGAEEGEKKIHFPRSPWRSINHRMTGARGEKRGINRGTSSVREFKEPEFDHAPASLVIGFSQPGFSILWATQQLRFSSKVKDIGEKKVAWSVFVS